MRQNFHLSILMIAMLVLGVVEGQSSDRRFAVRDSIEMTTFSNPSQVEARPDTCFSPDGSKLLIVTSRGEIATNMIHSDLLLFEVANVKRFLAEQNQVIPPKPILLASLAVTPRAFANRSYAALITELHWSSDSRFVFFLGQQSDGSNRLYRVNPLNRQVYAVSPSGIDVLNFAMNARMNVAFVGGPAKREMDAYSSLSGDQINQDARTVTGLSLQQILFPNVDNGAKPRIDSLWLLRAGSVARKIATENDLGGPDMDGASKRMLSLSPTGRYIICILPLKTISSAWSQYDPLPIFEFTRIAPADPRQTSVFNFNRTKAYFIFDMETGKRRQLIDAPFASPLGFHDKPLASWAPNEDKIVISDTFMPFKAGEVSNSPHKPACAAAVVDLKTFLSVCVVASRDQYHAKVSGAKGALQLRDAHFEDSNTLSLEFSYNNEDVFVADRYVQNGGTWTNAGSNEQGQSERLLSVSIRQDLNTAPTLWAMNNGSHQAKELLDPNPQLRGVDLGQASPYRWTDETGREWIGGLVLPVGYDPSRHYPLVIQTHGYEPHQFLVDGGFPTAMAARPLASAGIAVLQMGYSYEHMLSPQELDDQLMGYRSAIDRLARDGIVDKRRVGIIGFSRPVWHVESALERAPSLFVAATLADGIDVGYMQYLVFGEGNRPLASQFERTNGGPPFGGGLRKWSELAVPFHLDRVRTPIRIEAIGPASLLGEWENYSSLRQQGKIVDLVYIPNGQHILQTPLERLASQEGNVQWFCFWLVDTPTRSGCPNLSAAQAEKWGRMRFQAEAADKTPTHGETP